MNTEDNSLTTLTGYGTSREISVGISRARGVLVRLKVGNTPVDVLLSPETAVTMASHLTKSAELLAPGFLEDLAKMCADAEYNQLAAVGREVQELKDTVEEQKALLVQFRAIRSVQKNARPRKEHLETYDLREETHDTILEGDYRTWDHPMMKQRDMTVARSAKVEDPLDPPDVDENEESRQIEVSPDDDPSA